jgi:glyoxylase-like metal-dependent hydrolase (beta-lactamase superfamily II)
VEENGQIVPLTRDTQIAPGITMIHTPAHTEGGMSVRVETDRGSVLICGFCTILENLYPPKAVTAMEMEVISPGTHVNAYEAYETLVRAKTLADHILPLHEPKWAGMESVPE